jgi:ribosome-associated protein
MIGSEGGDGSESDAAPLEDRPSRTQRTRAAAEVNRLGQELAALSPRDLDGLDLPARLREELEVWRGLKPRARGRQSRLIGQILRAEDHEAIRGRFEAIQQVRRDGVRFEKENETWLARLLAEGDPGLHALVRDYPSADRQRLRTLARRAGQAPEDKRTQRARRELLRAIRALRS